MRVIATAADPVRNVINLILALGPREGQIGRLPKCQPEFLELGCGVQEMRRNPEDRPAFDVSAAMAKGTGYLAMLCVIRVLGLFTLASGGVD